MERAGAVAGRSTRAHARRLPPSPFSLRVLPDGPGRVDGRQGNSGRGAAAARASSTCFRLAARRAPRARRIRARRRRRSDEPTPARHRSHPRGARGAIRPILGGARVDAALGGRHAGAVPGPQGPTARAPGCFPRSTASASACAGGSGRRRRGSRHRSDARSGHGGGGGRALGRRGATRALGRLLARRRRMVRTRRRVEPRPAARSEHDSGNPRASRAAPPRRRGATRRRVPVDAARVSRGMARHSGRRRRARCFRPPSRFARRDGCGRTATILARSSRAPLGARRAPSPSATACAITAGTGVRDGRPLCAT